MVTSILFKDKNLIATNDVFFLFKNFSYIQFFLKIKYTSKLIEIIEDTTYPVNTPSGTPP